MPPDAAPEISSGMGVAEGIGLGMAGLPAGWRRSLAVLALAWMALIATFWHDWVAMAGLWWNSSTYNHVLFVPLIAIWLVRQRASQLLELEPCCWLPGIGLFALALLMWMLGAASGLDLARHAGAVAMLQAAAAALLGPKVVAGLLFPLAYLAFLVPFGDELVPTLQAVTAWLTIGLTRWSGIPARIDGVFIDTPAGLFEVAEACSGVKFLVAMIALGALVAQVFFRSWRRRAAFMAGCAIVPILANGVRAWGTIHVAQIYGAEFAVGFDHIVYGWIFFAIVIGILLGLAWLASDRPAHEPFIDPAAIGGNALLGRLARWSMPLRNGAALIGVLTLIVLLWTWAASRVEAQLPARMSLPPVEGWTRIDNAGDIAWRPVARGARHRLLGRYSDMQGRHVDLFVAAYARQDEDHDASGVGQGAVPPDGEWAWLGRGPAFEGAKSDWLLARGSVKRLAVTSYVVGDRVTGSTLRLKLSNVLDRLLFRRNATLMVIVSAEDRPGSRAVESVKAFRAAAGERGAWMDHPARDR